MECAICNNVCTVVFEWYQAIPKSHTVAVIIILGSSFQISMDDMCVYVCVFVC